MHFLEALGHFVDVVNIAKYQLTISVIPGILKPTALDPVGLRIQLRPGIEYHDPRIIDHGLTIIGCPTNFHQHILVVGGPPVVALRALRAPPNRSASILVVVGHRWQPVLRSELRASLNLSVIHITGNNQMGWVSSAQIVFFIVEHSELVTL